MTCLTHDWYFDSPCPKCAAATVTVTPAPPVSPPQNVERPTTPAPAPQRPTDVGGVAEGPDGDPVPPDATGNWPPSTDAMPPLPEFLRRNAENQFVDPTPWGSTVAFVPVQAPTPDDVRTWTDERLWEALNSNMSVADRQPIILEITRRQNRSKTYARLDKAGFTRQKDDTDKPE